MALEVSKVNIVGTASHPLLTLYSHSVISSTMNQLAKHLVSKFGLDSKTLVDELEKFEITLPKISLPTVTPAPIQENITLSVIQPAKRLGRPPKDPSKVVTKEKEEVEAPDISDVTSKEELDKFSANQLRAVLKQKNLRITGSKLDLVNRTWGILHPEEMPEDAKPKKRGRPSGKSNGSISSGSVSSSKQFNKVEDSEPEPESSDGQTELDPDDLEEIWVKNNTVSTPGEGEKYLLHSKWKWILSVDKENPEQITGFIGYLEGKKINTSRPIPKLFSE